MSRLFRRPVSPRPRHEGTTATGLIRSLHPGLPKGHGPPACSCYRLPVPQGRWHISRPAVGVLPSSRVDTFPPMEPTPKWRDSLPGAIILAFQRYCFDGLSRRRIRWWKRWNRKAVDGQDPPQPSILFPQTPAFCVWRLEWKRFRTVLSNIEFIAPCGLPAPLQGTPALSQIPRRHRPEVRILQQVR